MKITCTKDWYVSMGELLFEEGKRYEITNQKHNESTGVVSFQITSGDRSIWFHTGSEYFQIPNVKD